MSETPRPIRTLLRDGVDESRLQDIWQAVEARRSRRSAVRRALVPALVACCVLAGVAVSLREPQGDVGDIGVAAGEPLRLAGGEALSPAAAIAVGEGAPERVVALSDGTRITLAAGSRLVPRMSSRARIELAVERGRARFEVQPQRGRAFVVAAGATQVEVVGTVFSVERHPDATAVAVEHGRVRVRAPGLPGGERLLGAGDSLRAPEASAARATPAAAPGDAVPANAVTAPAPPQAETLTRLPGYEPAYEPVHDKRGADAARATPPAQTPAFRAAAASGDYAGAYALLGARGYARAVRAESEIDALLQLADVARGAGKSQSAALALARIIELHPRGDRSALAALTLGRLELDVLGHPAAAARALRSALAAGLPVALQEDALARLVDASSRAGERADAANAADEYRRRFPNGRWRARVEQWATSR